MDPEPQMAAWAVILIMLAFSAFFSGMEIAFVSANRLKIELDKNRGHLSGKILAYFVKKTGNFIAIMLLGNNVALVVYGIYMAIYLEPMLFFAKDYQFLMLFLQTIISTIIVVVTAEFLPKAIFRINPNGILNLFVFPLFIVYWVLYLPATIIIGISNLILKILKADVKNTEHVFTKVDLDHYVRDLSDRIEEDAHMDNEIQILNNALEFSKLKARDCLIPRTEIVACNIEEDIKILKEKFIQSGLSRILIYRNTIDNIIGYVHAYELFNKPDFIKNVMIPIGVVPESILAKDLLAQFSESKKNIVVVVDEYGGTAGIITVEDIIEEIFGEIKDEHDREDDIEEQLDESTYLFSGRTEIDYIVENYGLPIVESEEYETLAGLMITNLEEIPEPKESYESDKLIFTAIEVEDSRIKLIQIQVKD
jgi:putative hemolysin